MIPGVLLSQSPLMKDMEVGDCHKVGLCCQQDAGAPTHNHCITH